MKDSVDPAISYSMVFEEWQAAVDTGLDLWKWYKDEYSRDFKVRVIAFNNLRKLIEMHTQAAVAQKSEAIAKRGGRRI